MTLPLTKEMLAAAYDFLCTTPPFSKWNLPDGEDVVFKITRSRSEFAHYRFVDGRHTISVSSAAVGHPATLIRIMAHEAIHLHLEMTGMESKGGDSNTHNMAFRKLASHVCRIHGFDPKEFW
jgi:hypothetical protein